MSDPLPVPEAVVAARYRILTPIATGGMGAVYRARDLQTGGEVALKRLLDPRFAARFAIEARLLSRLRHPRVVRVLDHFQDRNDHYLVMPLVAGSDLARHLRVQGRPGLPIGEATDYALQACEALEYIHSEQVIHRDVKPRNLILSDRGVTLVDFGIAREYDPVQTGTAGIGTPNFMAPEVLGGGRGSPRSDVYGIAATLWTLLCGIPPHYGERRCASELVPDLPPPVDDALERGLALEPGNRTPSAAAFAQALGAPLGAGQGRSLAVSVPTAVASRRVLEAIARTAAGVFEAAATSIAFVQPSGELAYQVAWGAGGPDVLRIRLPRGAGIAGTVVESGEGIAVPDCSSDPRFAADVAAATGYAPQTMVVVPLRRADATIGVLTILDRRDGQPYGPSDIPRAALFADLSLTAMDAEAPAGQTAATAAADG